MIFDTHAHYDDPQFDWDRDEILACVLPEEDVARVVNVGCSLSEIPRCLALAEQWPDVYATVGIHPDELGEAEETGEEETMALLRRYAQAPKVVAIGEIGLDYHGDWEGKPDRAVQEKWFRLQLRLARELDLPIVVHSREAAADTLRIIREEGGPALSLVMHCFSYEKEIAREYLKMGHYLGIGGVVTFKNARRLKEVVQEAPLEQLLLETDAPYLAPEGKRGRRNHSGYLSYVITEIGRLKSTPKAKVAAATWENALRFYRMSE